MPRKLEKLVLFNRLSCLLALLLLVALSSVTVHADSPRVEDSAITNQAGSIVVTLKPLYSLAAHISEGIEAPLLLIDQLPHDHHYSLRPSQRKMLADASIIIRFSASMEPYLNDIIEDRTSHSDDHEMVITAMQAPELITLKRRGNADPHTAHHTAGIQAVDQHIWLSAGNAIAISRHIAISLSKIRPEHAATYEKNLAELIDRIRGMHEEIQATLAGVSGSGGQPFISYHDAFQYFEAEYQLNHFASVAREESTGPGLKHLREIMVSIKEHDIRCLVYQQPRPAMIDRLVDETSIKAVALDPLGRDSSDPKQAWFELMQNLAWRFAHCLKQETGITP